MNVRRRFRIYPTQEQEESLSKLFGCCRFVYNRALRIRTDSWFNEKKRVGFFDTSKLLPIWKKEEETMWLSEVSSVALQMSLRRLNIAFIRFWNKQGKYPKFHTKHGRQSADLTRTAFKIRDNKKLHITFVGEIKVSWSRSLKSAPSIVTIIKEPSGKYFATFLCEEVIKPLPKTGESIGIDMGINRLATLSNGECIPNPRFLTKNLRKLRLASKSVSRKQVGSNRRKVASRKVARIYEHIRNCKQDSMHKLTTKLVRKYDRIAIEDLCLTGMFRKKSKIGRSVGEAGLGMFRQMLTYKCEWYGKELVIVDRFFPSSKRCSHCGYTLGKLTRSCSQWVCPECGVKHDRDHNAAKNIHSAEGHSVQARGAVIRREVPSGTARVLRRSVN